MMPSHPPRGPVADAAGEDASARAAEPRRHTRQENRIGIVYGVAAFSWWGLMPVYFKAVSRVPALEVLAHRVFFSTLFLWGLLLGRRRIRAAVTALANRHTLLILGASTSLIAGNWLVFIWAVGHAQITQASLGYFINPLFNVMLGYVFLGERLRPMQKWSVLLATLGVVILTVHVREVPTVALLLPATFGLYGLIRKVAHVDALVGLTAETTLLTPLALGYLVTITLQGRGHLGTVSPELDVLLVSSGVVTALPLIWFLNAARRLRLSTLGFLQYIAPTVQLLLGVIAYREPFTTVHLLSFGLVWTGLAVYIIDAVKRMDR